MCFLRLNWSDRADGRIPKHVNEERQTNHICLRGEDTDHCSLTGAMQGGGKYRSFREIDGRRRGGEKNQSSATTQLTYRHTLCFHNPVF
jgi:hypothetical protein